MEGTFWWLVSWCIEHIRSVHDVYQVTKGSLFKVTMYTAHISSNESHFLLSGFLVYWTYKVSKIWYSRTKLVVTIYSKYSPQSDSYQVTTGELFKVTMYTAHIGSNGSLFLMTRVLVYWTYKVSKFGNGQTKWMVTIYSEYTAHISSNGSQLLTTWFLVYWTYDKYDMYRNTIG